MAYYFNLNNIYDTIETNLNIISWLLAYYIPIQSNAEKFKIRKQFHNFKFWFNDFVSLALF